MHDEESLIQFEKDWDLAMISNDAEEIGKFMSDDWVVVGSDGITSKAEFLESIRSGAVTHSKMESDEKRVKVYGPMGVITSRGISAGNYKGQPFGLYEWSSSTFFKEEGRWRCVLTMLTPVTVKV